MFEADLDQDQECCKSLVMIQKLMGRWTFGSRQNLCGSPDPDPNTYPRQKVVFVAHLDQDQECCKSLVMIQINGAVDILAHDKTFVAVLILI